MEAQQSKDQIGFRSSVGVDDAFAVFENVCSKSMEWSVPMWCASLDLRKAFDRIEYNALFDALKVQGVPYAYLKLIASLYHEQVGLVQGRQFPIKRGVKQGDVLSPLLFNAGLEHAMRKWKLRIQHCGLHCGHNELLTNVRYADDLMLYARSDTDLANMVECLVEELAAVGLTLNTSKTKILTTENLKEPWWGMLSCAQQTAVASTLLGNAWRSPAQPFGDEGPQLSAVLQLADSEEPSRLPLRS